jgi:hypothetical protein
MRKADWREMAFKSGPKLTDHRSESEWFGSKQRMTDQRPLELSISTNPIQYQLATPGRTSHNLPRLTSS